MSRSAPWLPLGWAALLTVLLAVPFSSVSWSFIDTYNVLHQAIEPSWGETVTQSFGSAVEYRPLMTLLTKLTHQLVGLRLWFYKILVLLQFAAILGLLVWLFRPESLRRAAAACVAISCLVGLHTSRDLFLFVPLNAHALGLLLLLVAAVAAVEPWGAGRTQWAWCPLTLGALLILESGLLIGPVVALLWLVRAPGATGRAVMGAVAGTACYLAIRFTLSGYEVPSVYVETGIGFSDASPERLREIFGRAPWMLWLYNVVAGFLTVVASEPRVGVFKFVRSLLDGDTPVWRWLHVGSSLATTALVVTVLRARPLRSSRDQHLAVVGLVLVVFGSALGFLYARDRVALSAGVGYAVLVYVTLATLLERARDTRWNGGAAAVVGILAAAWIVRDGETYFQIRDRALEHRVEWTTRYDTLLAGRSESDLMLLLRAAALRSTPADPRADPAWTHALFERRFNQRDER